MRMRAICRIFAAAAPITDRRAMSSSALATASVAASMQQQERTDAGPSSHATARQATLQPLASSSSASSLEHDRRGYPDRTYSTEVLRALPSSVRWKQKGKEPIRDIDVALHDEGHSDKDDVQCHQALQRASHALRHGHLVAFPTETVYGLAGNALDAEAASKIFQAKGRPADNPLIVHISDMNMLQRLVPATYELSAAYAALVQAFWPGPLTILVPVDEQKVPSVVRCGLTSLGVRMPSHPVARALIATSKLPLAAPSANVSGKPSPTTAQHVFRDMTTTTQSKDGEVVGRIPYILDGGASDVGLESTVVDAITNPNEVRVLRPGGVSVEAIEQALQQSGLMGAKDKPSTRPSVTVRVYGRDMAKDENAEMNPTTPGMKYRHYSPEAQVIVLITGSKNSANRRALASQTLGQSVAQTLVATRAQDVIAEQVQQYIRSAQGENSSAAGRRPLRVGLMSMDDSPLTATLLSANATDAPADSFLRPKPCDHGAYILQSFSLGLTGQPEQAAHRLFDGLRTLDGSGSGEGPEGCDLIFVEAVDDANGVGLAIMNRLNKAASQTILVDV